MTSDDQKTSKSSKTLPFIVLGILVATLLAESYYETEIDLEAYLPLLVAIGVGGAAKSAIQKAAKAKNAMTDDMKKIVKEEVQKVIPPKGSQ